MTKASDSIPFVPQRVHVAAVGFEVDRVAEPIIEMRGELAILLANVEGEDLGTTFRATIVERLRKARIKAETIRAPIFDLYATTQAILSILRSHRKDRLYVNVSSGSKVQALSGYIATSLARSEGLAVEAYYAEPEGYAPTEGDPLSHGFRQAFVLPSLTVRTPSTALRAAMRLLAAGPLSKVDLAVKLAQQGVLDADRLAPTGRPKNNASRVSLLTSLDVRVIRPLSEWGFLDSVRVGKHIRVNLSAEGELGLRLYDAEDLADAPGTETSSRRSRSTRGLAG